jgi:hypothetical protein
MLRALLVALIGKALSCTNPDALHLMRWALLQDFIATPRAI